MALIAHMANRWLAPNANAVILPLAALLNGIGYVDHRPLGPRPGPGPGRLGGARRAALRAHAAGRALLARSGALPLPAFAPGRHSPRRPALLLPHRRRPTLGALREPVLPAGRVLQDPSVHLLRVLLRGEQGVAHHPDGPDRQSAHTSILGRCCRSWSPGAPPWPSSASRTTSGLPRCSSCSSSDCSGWPPDGWATWSSAWCCSASAPTSPPATSARCTCGSSSGRTPGRRRPKPRRLASWPRRWYSMGTGGVGGTGLGFDHYAGYIPD